MMKSIQRVTVSHLKYADTIIRAIKIKAEKKNIMQHSYENIKNVLESRNGYIFVKNGVFDGFVCLDYWNNYVEISALIVSPNFRNNNLGDYLFQSIKKLAIKKSKKRPVLILANHLSSRIALKHNFKIKLDLIQLNFV